MAGKSAVLRGLPSASAQGLDSDAIEQNPITVEKGHTVRGVCFPVKISFKIFIIPEDNLGIDYQIKT